MSEFNSREPEVFADGTKYFDLADVVNDVKAYMKIHLSQYTILLVRPKSTYAEDYYLYQVIGRKENGSFACWTTWNELTQGLHHGHYDLTSYEEALEVLNEYASYRKAETA